MGAEDKQNPMAGITNMIQQMTQGMAGQAGTDTPSGWLSSFKYPETFDFNTSNLINFARSSLFSQALGTNPTVYDKSIRIYNHEGIGSEIAERLKLHICDEFGAKLVYVVCNQHLNRHFYVFNSGAISIDISYKYGCLPSKPEVEPLDVHGEIVSTAQNFIKMFDDIMAGFSTSRVKMREIHEQVASD